MLPDFNRLKVFYHIFLQQSVSSAAKELNITSSAVSQSLNKLEEELNVLLFTRLHKKLIPTQTGEQLFDIVDPFVKNLEVGIEQIQQARQVPSGMVRIGSPIEFGKSYFPRLMAAFRREYPEVIFTLTLGDPSEIFSMISNGEIDFGMVDVFFTRDQLQDDFGIYSIEPLIDEEMIMACSKEYYDREIQGDHSLKNLVSKEYISYQKSSLTLRNWFKHHFNKFSLNLNRVLTVDSHQAVITGIKNHLGIGVIATNSIKWDIKMGRIVTVKTDTKDIINKISLVQLQDKIPSLTEKTFIKYLKTDIFSSKKFKKSTKLS